MTPCPQVSPWGGCGGVAAFALNSSNPALCCPSGHSCQYYTEHFWQCMPDSLQESNKPVGTWDDKCREDKVRAGRTLLVCGWWLWITDGYAQLHMEEQYSELRRKGLKADNAPLLAFVLADTGPRECILACRCPCQGSFSNKLHY
jgi:hypothetical protein